MTDQHDQLECEHRELRIKYFELKQQHDELADKMKYFTKVWHFEIFVGLIKLLPLGTYHSCYN